MIDGRNENISEEHRNKYGLGTIRNLSSGCKTLLNIVKHPDKVVNVEECGPNVFRIIFTMNNPVSMSPLSGDRKPQIRF